MNNGKILKSIDLSSATIVGTGVKVSLSIIASIIFLLITAAVSSSNLGGIGIIIPTIVFGTLIYSIYEIFTKAGLFNWISGKMNPVIINFKEDKEITAISASSTSLIVAIIETVMMIIIVLISLFGLSLIANSIIQTLMMSGQMGLAYTMYQGYSILSQPAVLALIIVATFILSFVVSLIAIYLYNLLANKIGGIEVNLAKDGDYTLVNSVGIKKATILFVIIGAILGLIIGIIIGLSSGQYIQILSMLVTGIVTGLIEGVLVIGLYNFLAPKLGAIKIELVDQ